MKLNWNYQGKRPDQVRFSYWVVVWLLFITTLGYIIGSGLAMSEF